MLNKNAYASFSISNDKKQITFTGVKASRSQYAAGRTPYGHFYVLIQVLDSTNPTDTGMWMPVALSVKDNAATEETSRPSSLNMIAGTSQIFSPFGMGTIAKDWVSIQGSGGTLDAPNTAYPALAGDNDIKTYPIEATDGFSAEYLTTNQDLRNMNALEDMLFIDAAKSAQVLNGTNVTYTVGGVTYTANFNKFFRVEFVDMYLPYNVTARLSSAEYSYATANGKYFTVSTVQGINDGNLVSDYEKQVIVFKGLKITALAGTQGLNIEFGVALQGIKEALRGVDAANLPASTALVSRVLVSVVNNAPYIVGEGDFASNNTESGLKNGESGWIKNSAAGTGVRDGEKLFATANVAFERRAVGYNSCGFIGKIDVSRRRIVR